MRRLVLVLAAGFSGLCLATPYYWHGDAWGDFGTADNWTLGDSASPYADSGAEASVPPTSSDWLYAVGGQTKLDLGGKAWSLVAFGTEPAGGKPSATAYFSVTNGTLTLDVTSQTRSFFYIYDKATLVSHFNYLGWGGDKTYDVYPGGRLEISPTSGYLRAQRGRITVEEGAEAVIDVSQFGIHRGATSDTTFENGGYMSFPSGCAMCYPTMTGSEQDSYTVKWMLRQNAGTLELGGDVGKKLDTKFPFHFEANGGTVRFTSSMAFVNMAVAHVTAGNAVTFQCDGGASVDARALSYDEDSTVVKTGSGELCVSATPPTFDVRAGVVRFLGEPTATTAYTAAENVRFIFASKTYPAFSAALFAGYDVADFAIDESLFATGDTIVSSPDADFLTRVAARINANLSADVDYQAKVQDGCVRLGLKTTEYVFDATKSDDLSNAEAWGGEVPPATATVTLSGAGTVRMTPASPRFASVILANGVRLDLTGGTEDRPLDVPSLNLVDGVACHVTDGSYVTLTNGFVSSGTRTCLPVFEIETNATAFVGWLKTSAAQPVVAVFRNIDFRLHGILMTPTQPDTSTYMQLTFGSAEDGETTYLAFRSEGGRIKRTYTGSTAANENTSLVNFAKPAPGGRVEVVGEIVLKDFTATPGNIRTLRHGFTFGVDNPTDAPFDVVCSGTTTLIANAPSTFAGAAHVTFADSAALERGSSIHNVTVKSSVTVRDLATLDFEPGSRFFLYHANPTGSGFHVMPSDEDREVLTLRGATFQSADGDGNTNAIARIEDAAYEIGHRAPVVQGTGGAPSSNRIAVLAGVKAVRIPEGKSLTVRAVSDASYSSYSAATYQWHRLAFLDAPAIGGGNVIVSNALTGTYAKWGTTLAVTSGANGLTGEIRAETNVLANVVFQDGANWTGTVVANGRVSLTNDAWEVTGAPATVAFNNIRFEGTLPIRIWRTDNGLTNDVVNLTAWEGVGGFEVVCMDGCVPGDGEVLTLGLYPADAPLPPVVGRRWHVVSEPVDATTVRLKLVYSIPGLLLLLK